MNSELDLKVVRKLASVVVRIQPLNGLILFVLGHTANVAWIPLSSTQEVIFSTAQRERFLRSAGRSTTQSDFKRFQFRIDKRTFCLFRHIVDRQFLSVSKTEQLE